MAFPRPLLLAAKLRQLVVAADKWGQPASRACLQSRARCPNAGQHMDF